MFECVSVQRYAFLEVQGILTLVKKSWDLLEAYTVLVFFTHLTNLMTRKGKGRGKKTSISKQLHSSPGHLNSPSSPNNQELPGEQKLDDSKASEIQIQLFQWRTTLVGKC